MALSLLPLAALLAAAPNGGQTNTATATTTRTATISESGLVPPKLIGSSTIAMPSDLPPIETSTSVTVRIRVESSGRVSEVELVRGAHPLLDEATIEGVRRLHFEPGRFNGEPVTVDIRYTQTFEPPRSDDSSLPAAAQGVLAGRVRERGTRRSVVYATVTAFVRGVSYSAATDEQGRFELTLPVGTATVTVVHSDFRHFVQLESIEPDRRLEVGYLIEASAQNPYEVMVFGKRERTEVSSTSLTGRDLKQVPGTFGDPFRVIATLPGVSQVTSLLPYPVVRGSSPGNTGFLIDGVRVPLLFHLLAGPSVIHPELIESIEFSPGGFPVEYGGYVGGIVDGKTTSGAQKDRRYEADINLFQAGLFGRQPIEALDGAVTVAGRVGYPGFLLGLANPRVSLNYWDYQARWDGGDKRSGYTIFFFGANDGLDQIPNGEPDTAPKEPFLRFQFHRLDLRYHHRSEKVEGTYQLTGGYDGSLTQEDAQLDGFYLTPRARLAIRPSDQFELRLGLDAQGRWVDFASGEDGSGALGDLIGAGSEPSAQLYSIGGLTELLIRPTPRLLLRPGVRVDLYSDTRSEQVGVDPRLLVRYRILDEDPGVWLKGTVGLYHQPPRFTIPIPGLDQIAFEQGLLEAVQTSLGAEARFAEGWSVDVQGYYNWMDPILFDVRVNPTVEDLLNQPPGGPPGQVPDTPPTDFDGITDRLDQLLTPATGRSYGLELLLRREAKSGLSGWISYTLSRSERLQENGFAAFDFDRTHLLNLVLSLTLPRDWQLGLRGQLQTGRPITTSYGLADARVATFIRFDVRVDKTVIWNDWILDFYIDISNAILAAEELSPGVEVRYVLPTVGFRAFF